MGDIADDLIDQGMDEMLRHDTGECEDECPYCDGRAKETAIYDRPSIFKRLPQ